MSAISPAHACWACGAASAPLDDPAGRGLWLCPSCGLRFAPELESEDVRDLYDQSYFEDYGGEVYADSPDQRAYEASLRLRYVSRFQPDGDLLEVGVAGGWFLEAAKESGYAVRGIEPAEEMAESARSRFGLAVETAFVEDAKLDPASTDVVCGWHVLEHIPEPLDSMRRLRETLRPGGVAAFEVPNADSDQARTMGKDWPHWDYAHHVSHFGPRSIAALLERAGYTDVEVETIHGSDYHRPSVALKPGNVAGAAKRALTGGGLAYRSHPSKKEMLRAAGRRPE